MKPKVSICLPTLNSIEFLEERISSIVEQDFDSWEVVAFDSYSTDGTAERIKSWADADPRVKIHQSAPDGIYTNINRCIEAAQGEYVYIATSDDNMPSNCLSRLASALDRNENCGLAHCIVKIVDEKGEPQQGWWDRRSILAMSGQDILKENHVRVSPFDGLLHFLGVTVYTSLTQLLIRREIFDGPVGYFSSQWGSIGDFNWVMRATFRYDTAHVSDTWGGWRVHSKQATANRDTKSPAYHEKVKSMASDAISSYEKKDRLPAKFLKDYQAFCLDFDRFDDWKHKKRLTYRKLLCFSKPAFAYIRQKYVNGHRTPRDAGIDIVKAIMERKLGKSPIRTELK